MAGPRRTDPALWERVKREITNSDKGGEPGQWSARKAQLAVQAYKRRGGGYEGKKPDTHLDEWTREDWGTRSGRRSRDTGERYLPRKARESLTAEEYRRTSEKKRRDMRRGRQFSGQPSDIARKTARFRESGAEGEPTLAELREIARERDIAGRSKMDKEELAAAIDGSGESERGGGSEPTKAELTDEARARGIEGRSKMDKAALRKAIAEADREPTRAELMEEARRRGVEGRSKMSKGELRAALG